MNQFYRKIIVFKLIILLLLMQSVASFVFADYGLNAQTSQVCDENLEAADDAYYDGEYSESFRLIKLCLEKPDITNEQRSLAFSILARTFMAMDNPEKASEYIDKILDLNPDYLPTIEEETPKYVDLVTLVRKEKAQQKQMKEESGISSWVWIGAGGVVATAAIIAIASSGSNDDEPKDKPLPEPPVFP
jgi:tetratricopeptide (TPR) repeat protein